MSMEPGANLGQYRIVERLGRGGMATVYKAFQPGLDRYVAVKVLPAFLAEEPTYLERFRQEAKSVARLRHPNILAVFDFGEQDGITFIVSEFVPGGTLAEQMGRPLPSDYIVSVLRPVASALDYAHSQSILHRDVKPSNILLTLDGTPILSDFGLARMTGGARLTESGATVGTPEYMSPEQAMGGEIGPASDIYSMGIILYEMVTGKVPFSAETPMAVVLAHLHNPLPPPRTLVPGVSEDIEAVILKALAKRPEDRFRRAGEMVGALDRALSAPSRARAGVPPAPAVVKATAAAEPGLPAAIAAPSVFGPPIASEPTPRGKSRDGRSSRSGLHAAVLGAAGILAVLLIGGAAAVASGLFGGGTATQPRTGTPQPGQPGPSAQQQGPQDRSPLPPYMTTRLLEMGVDIPPPVRECIRVALGPQAVAQLTRGERQPTPEEAEAIRRCLDSAPKEWVTSLVTSSREAGKGDGTINFLVLDPSDKPMFGVLLTVSPRDVPKGTPSDQVRVWTDSRGRATVHRNAGRYDVALSGFPATFRPPPVAPDVVAGQAVEVVVKFLPGKS